MIVAALAAAVSCAGLGGPDLAPARTVKLVQRAPGRYVACTVPSGIRRAITSTGRIEVLDVAGAQLLVRQEISREVHRYDLATGRRFGLGRSKDAVVAPAGETAALRGTTLWGRDVDGTPHRIATGVLAVRRSGDAGLVLRLRTGPRRERLDEPRRTCGAGLPGRTVLSSPLVRVTAITFASEFLVGEVTGRTTRLRACAVGPDATLRTLGETAVDRSVQGGQQLDVLGSAGVQVLVRERSTDSQGDVTPDRLTLVDARSGRRAAIYGDADADGPHPELGDLVRAVLTGGAVPVAAFDGQTRQIVALHPGREPVVLASGPGIELESLRARGDIVTWTQDTGPRSVEVG